MFQPVSITGTGSYLPGEPVPAASVGSVLGYIEGMPRRVAQHAELIEKAVLERTGVKQRYYALDPVTRKQTESIATMAEKAIRRAADAADVDPTSFDLLVLACPIADYGCPPTSAIVQGNLGIDTCAEFEIHSNCTGTPKAIQVALDMMRCGRYKRAAVAYVQLSSVFLRAEYFNPAETRLANLALRWILSDGSGALILEAGERGTELVDTYVESIGGGAEPGMSGLLYGGFGHDLALNGKGIFPSIYEKGAHHVTQNTLEVARLAPGHLVDGVARMLKQAGVTGDDVAQFLLGIPGMHFINEAMIEKFRDLMDTDPLERGRWSLIDDFGYCGGATMLVQFDRLMRSGTVKPGDLIAAYLEESSKWMSGGFLARGR